MQVIKATWPPNEHGVEAFTTTRLGGFSSAEFSSFNVGLHVNDERAAVLQNRHALQEFCAVPKFQWLEQTHSIDCIKASGDTLMQADACWTDEANLACAVMTADCLPVAFRQGKKIAVAHAGWRGLLAGVLENTLQSLDEPSLDSQLQLKNRQSTQIWLGPAIGSQAFEVGEEVKTLFVNQDANAEAAFVASDKQGKWLADIYQLAKIKLCKTGISIENIYGADYCTHTDQQHFFSYRKQPITGRMATVIYRK